MTKVNPNMALFLAQTLDAKDGKSDGKISASVWNEFVHGKGGKSIKYSITLENATRSISTYFARNSKKTGKSKEGLCVEWLQQQDNTPYTNEKMKNIDKIMGFEALNKKNALKPETIEKEANAIVDFINGKSEQFFINPDNASQVFLKASEQFNCNRMPSKIGTAIYLKSLLPMLIKKAKALGIITKFAESKNRDIFTADIQNKITACQDLAYQIVEKEKDFHKIK